MKGEEGEGNIKTFGFNSNVNLNINKREEKRRGEKRIGWVPLVIGTMTTWTGATGGGRTNPECERVRERVRERE